MYVSFEFGNGWGQGTNLSSVLVNWTCVVFTFILRCMGTIYRKSHLVYLLWSAGAAPKYIFCLWCGAGIVTVCFFIGQPTNSYIFTQISYSLLGLSELLIKGKFHIFFFGYAFSGVKFKLKMVLFLRIFCVENIFLCKNNVFLSLP